MASVKNYLSLIKFSHTIFAMPFALIGFALGVLTKTPFATVDAFLNSHSTTPGWRTTLYSHGYWELVRLFVLVILCMITARSAAMAFNRYLDRQFDAKNPRTAGREIPAGIISEKNALFFTIVMCVLFIACTFFINSICFYLSPVALFVILFYSYTKRFTFLCHLVLGLGLSLAPIGAYLAVTGQFSLLPILFSITVICWVSGFDIIYALQDEAFDKDNNLYSIPSVAGKPKALHISELLHVISAAAVIGAGFCGYFGILYWAGAAVFCGMLIYQHSVVKADDLRRVNLAFMTANGIASVVFAVFVLADIFLKY